MLTAFKEFLHLILPYVLYAALWFTLIVGAIKRPSWPFYLLIVLIPMPNLWYKLQGMPLGSQTMDLLVASSLVGLALGKEKFVWPPQLGLIIAIVLATYAATWNAALRFGLPAPLSGANPAIENWKNYIEMLLLYVLAFNIVRTEKDLKIALALIAAVVLFISVREVRNFTVSSSFSYDKRAAGPFWQVGLGANHFGAFLAHFGAFFLGIWIMETQRWRRWLYLATAVAVVQPLFFSYSRGAYAGIVAAVAAIGLIKKRSLLLGLLVLAIVWQTVLPPTVVERITMTETASGQIEESAAMRLVLWDHATQLFEDNPLFGIGYDAFRYTVPRGSLTDTHNFYLKIACEQGVLGLILLAATLLSALATGWHAYRSRCSELSRAMGLGFIGCVTAVLVTNVFGDRWSYFALGGYFWIVWGLVDRARRGYSRAAERRPFDSAQRPPEQPNNQSTAGGLPLPA